MNLNSSSDIWIKCEGVKKIKSDDTLLDVRRIWRFLRGSLGWVGFVSKVPVTLPEQEPKTNKLSVYTHNLLYENEMYSHQNWFYARLLPQHCPKLPPPFYMVFEGVKNLNALRWKKYWSSGGQKYSWRGRRSFYYVLKMFSKLKSVLIELRYDEIRFV